MILGCLGAEVIRIESTTRPDPIRVMPPFVPEPGETGLGFGGATLAQAQEAAEREPRRDLLQVQHRREAQHRGRRPQSRGARASAQAGDGQRRRHRELRRPGHWRARGLDYETLRELRPDIIYVSMCGYGHVGPDSHYVTMGPTAQALTGLTHLVGLPDREPAGWSFSYLDHVGGYLGAYGVLTALGHRRATGEGQHVDVSQLEPATALGGPLVLDRSVNGRSSACRISAGEPQGWRAGGREPRWRDPPALVVICVIPTTTGTGSSPRWITQRGLRHPLRDPRRPGGARRRPRSPGRDVDRVARGSLRDHGSAPTRRAFPVGVVQDAADRVERDPQLAARGHFTRLASTEVGELPLEGVPFTLSATPPDTGRTIHRGPPDLDEDRDDVLRDVLGLDADQIEHLDGLGAPVIAKSGVLAGVRVAELVDEPVEYCGRLLAGLGADVVKLEPERWRTEPARRAVRRRAGG